MHGYNLDMRHFEPHIHTFSNQLRLAYLQSDSLISHLGVNILAGSRFEKTHEVGLAHFLEHCIFKGTKKRKAFHILSRLDAVGGELNAYTAKEEMVVYGSFREQYLDRAAELIADILLNSHFPEKEIDKEKMIILDEINSYLDSPADKIFDDYEALLFPNHPLGNNILGTPDTVQSFTTKSLEDFMKRRFTAENMVVSYVGNLPMDKVIRILEKYLLQIPSSDSPDPTEFFSKPTLFKVQRPEANYQSHVVLGGYAPGYNEEERKGLTLLLNYLGGPALNARLNLSIREKYGYSYTVESNYSPYEELGFWSIYYSCDERNLQKSLRVLHRELKQVCDRPLSVSQMKMMKEQYKGQLALGMESHSGLMQSIGKSLLIFNQIDTLEELYHSIDQINENELLRLANKYLNSSDLSHLIFTVS